jgi:hypothetical protein
VTAYWASQLMCFVRFGSAFGGRHLAIVGGVVPGLLAPRTPPGIPPHMGTADLDFHLSLHLLDGETADYYRAIIDGLRSLHLKARQAQGCLRCRLADRCARAR